MYPAADDFSVYKAGIGWEILSTIEPVKLDCSDADYPIGTDVRIEGFPWDFGFSVVWGRTFGSRMVIPERPYPLIPINASLAQGASGSPVFNEDTNKVIGVFVSISTQNPNLGVATPINVVCQVLHYGEQL